ncbi:27447_t:CDS:2, partial [Dentiscutata erythropus]
MSIHDQYQLDSYDNDIIALSNESNVLPEQSTSQNNGVTVITNSLGKRIQKKKLLCATKNRDLVKVGQEYELSTRTGNLKSHLRQVHRILPPETNNKNNQLVNIASNQSSLHDFLNKKTPLPSSKRDKITNRILAWVVDDLQSFYATTNSCFRDMILECEPRFMFL